ncbi:TlpA family protein disulfide reductase [Leptospira langatensis]|uniref:TlpA family protein disulfide reductase n=1 Tax=Leptospira langatensis TaxID=2484983 RepID=A0A5F1ZRI9_9LEPT|nr:TlpA family protein disulfide reductase [Leptospira langatensis]TGK05514.1 TlpA family protein disulfide reductase [Leptospira langatensis]TGL38650.1 TlpA family protein disulfide reductase [Leptospira langatensis]
MDSQANSDSRLSYPRFRGIFFRLNILFITAALAVCAPSEQSNLGVQSFEGITLEGKPIRISEIPAERVALNVYGPNCIPCVKEVPVLNYLHAELQKDPHIKLYMVVDPTVFFDNPETLSEEELLKQASVLMKEEVRKFGIKLPVIIMKNPFRISRSEGLVTGTPETLLFKTKPLVLYYNFIGPISEEADAAKIPKDMKVIFFKRMAGQS